MIQRPTRFQNASDLPVHFVETKGGRSACGKQISLGRKTQDPEQVTCQSCKNEMGRTRENRDR